MKGLLYFSVLLSCVFAACKSDSSNSSTASEAKEQEETIYTMAEEMPRFPGCEELKGEKRQGCANIKLLEFVRSNLKYPAAAKEAGKEGRAVIGFNIEKDGSISNTEIIIDPGEGMGEEAKRVVESFPNFHPGKQEGKAVIVRYNLPIKFRLDQ